MGVSGSEGDVMASWSVALFVLFPAALWAYEVAESVEDKLAANEANYYAVDATGLLVGKLAQS